MHFGKTLQTSVYEPWRNHYIDYDKLKQLLHEASDDSDHEGSKSSESQPQWTEREETAFAEEIMNVQLEKVHSFQQKMSAELKARTARCEACLKALAPEDGEESGDKLRPEERKAILETTKKELDAITNDINELEKFSRINFTGFLKAAKKHDRRSRGPPSGPASKSKGKGKESAPPAGYNIKPLLQVRLSELEFNREDYSPLLYRLSMMYAFMHEKLGSDETAASDAPASIHSADIPGSRKYSSLKFWVHPDNIIEVKTFILRRLPVLIYNPQPTKEIDYHHRDPTITSLYFDNDKLELYTRKVLKKRDAASLRLRWYGQLSEASEIYFERKTIRDSTDESEGANEERISLKPKYVNNFIKGEYSMEKTIQKMRDGGSGGAEDVEKYRFLVQSLQDFIRKEDLKPMMRASYTRTAFQIPGDNRIRVSLDTDLTLVREDDFDDGRRRKPGNWHRTDIDEQNVEDPYHNLGAGELCRFPYALLELKVLDSALDQRSKNWINELIYSHLVHSAPRFSKFVHGISVLFEDYVNCFPFWLGELNEDIRKNPDDALIQERKKKEKDMEDELAVGSFTHTVRDFGGRGSPRRVSRQISAQGKDPKTSDSKFPPASLQDPENINTASLLQQSNDSAAEETDTEERHTSKGAASLENLRNLFPTFSSSRYGRAHRGHSRDVQLPPGVEKPRQLLMYQNPVQVESKVWFANQRTFLKWMHISVLIASLSTALYNAAGQHNSFARAIAIVYTAIAVFAGAWGYAVYLWRSNLIQKRSGKDFDAVLGPVVVCGALAVALVINFILKYKDAHRPGSGNGPSNHTLIEEGLGKLQGLVEQKGFQRNTWV